MRDATGKSRPIFAVSVKLNDNPPGLIFEIHTTGWNHDASSPPVGLQHTDGIPLTGRDPRALQRRYYPFAPLLFPSHYRSQLVQVQKGHILIHPGSSLLV